MNTQINKTQDKKSQSVANEVSQKKRGNESTFQFPDNRPEAAAQRKLQEMVKDSPRIMQLSAIQKMANNSLEIKQAAQLGSNVKEKNVTQCQSSSVIQLDKMTDHRLIQAALNAFINSWTADKVKGDVKGAFDALSSLLGKWGIKYGDQAASKASFPDVHGLHIGEILDMLNTLHNFKDDSSGFIPEKFWDKVLKMSEMMGEIAEE